MLEYEDIKVYKENDRYVVENGTNKITFYGVSAEEAAAFIRALFAS